jgi:hypothetical protein
MKKSFLSFLTYFILAYLLLFLAFQSTVWIESAHHDNTRYFRSDNSVAFKSNCYNDSQYPWIILTGRPITAQVECQVFKNTLQLDDLNKMRVAVIGLIATAAAVLALILLKLGVEQISAFLIALAIFSLPGMQNAAFMTNFANAVTPLLALLAYFLIDPIRNVGPWKYSGEEWTRALGAFIWLLIAALTYPAIAFLFFLGGMARLFMARQVNWRMHATWLVRDTLIFSCSMLAGIVVVKIVIANAMISLVTDLPDHVKSDLSLLSIVGKAPFLWNEVLPYAASFWFMYKGFLGNAVLAVLIIASVYIFISTSFKNKKIEFTQLRLALIFLMLCLFTFAPFMLAKFPPMYQRVLFPGMAGLLLTLFILIPRAVAEFFPKKRACLFLSAVLALTGLVTASFTQTQNVWNTNAEMMFIRAELAQYETLPRRVHVIQPIKNSLGFNGRTTQGDEFNSKTTDFERDIPEIITLSYYGSNKNITRKQVLACNPMNQDCEAMIPKDAVILSTSEYGNKFCRSDDMVVIDMNRLVRAMHTGKPALQKLDDIPWCADSKIRNSNLMKIRNK